MGQSPMPLIGHHDHSYNNCSFGGQWSGFCVYLDGPIKTSSSTNSLRVDFSPLTWADVKASTEACSTMRKSPRWMSDPMDLVESENWTNLDAQLSVKVWIIQDGESLPSHLAGYP